MWIRSDEGLTLETSAFRSSVRWPIYIINSVDKTKFLYIAVMCSIVGCGQIIQRHEREEHNQEKYPCIFACFIEKGKICCGEQTK